MSYSYEYDESGLASSYLALSFLIPVTLVYGFVVATRRQKKFLECGCCKKRPRRSWSSFIILFMLVGLLSYFVNNIRTIKMDIKKDFDPLEILGVTLESSKKTIKRKMQSLLMKYAINKAPEGKKEEYERKCVDISKAYVIMKNKEAFNSWLNTESKSGEIMAIPDIIMKNAFIAFFVYCLILGAALPFYAYRKWKSMRNKNRLGVDFRSMEEFLNYFNEDLRKRGGDPRSLMWILSRSQEFGIRTDMHDIRELVGTEFGYPLPDPKSMNDGYFILCDLLFRTGLAKESERAYIQKTTLLLIDSMKYIAFNKGHVEVLKGLFTFQAMVVQAVFDEEYFLLQFPFVSFRDLYIFRHKKGKLQVEEILSVLLNDVEFKEVERLRGAIPKVEVEEFTASVRNTGQASEDASDVEDEEEEEDVEKKGREDVQVFNIPRNSLVTIKARLSSTNSDLAVHSHFMQEVLDHSWTVFMTIDGILHKRLVKFHEKSKDILFEFETPGNKKSSEIKLFLLDGFYLRNNLEKSMIIKYV